MTSLTLRRCCAALALIPSHIAYAQPPGTPVTPPGTETSPVEPAPQKPEAAAASAPAASEVLGEIIVTAQRRAESLRDVPLTITAQSGEDLQNAGIGNVRELGISVPGLSFTTQGTFAQPAIRGVQTTLSQAGADSPIAIYLDGFYQPNQVGNVFDLPDVERIEVLKGPQGTLFGRNATGGAIVVHTLDPSFTPTGQITISDGLYFGEDVKTSNEFSAKGYISGPLVEDVLAIGVAGYYDYVDGYLTNDVDGGRAGRIESYLARVKLLFQPADGVRFILSGLYGDRKDDAAAAIQPLDGVTSAALYPDAIVPTEPWHVAGELKDGTSPSRAEHKAVTLRGDIDIGDAGTLTSLTGYTVVEAGTTSDVDSAYSPSCLAAFGCIIYDLDYGPTKTFQQELSFASKQFGAFSFVVGAFLYRDNHKIESNVNPPLLANGDVDRSTPGAFFNEGRVKTKAYAGFGELYWDITDDLRVITGLRYSWEKKTGRGSTLGGPEADFGGAPSWDSWTPRVSVLYELSDAVNLYATYSEGFKSGVIDSVGLSNDVADPEKLTAYEAGVKVGTPLFSLNAAGFYYDYSDLQVQFFNGTRTLLANAANAEIYGFEADATVEPIEGLELRAAGSWVPRAKYKDFPTGVDFALPMTPFGMGQVVVDASGFRMLKAPKFTGTLSANYSKELGFGTIEANGTLYYSSSYKWNLLGRVTTGSYVTLNGQLALTPAGSRFRFSLWGKNLTNKAFIGGSILSGNSDGVVYAQPRQVGVSVGYSF